MRYELISPGGRSRPTHFVRRNPMPICQPMRGVWCCGGSPGVRGGSLIKRGQPGAGPMDRRGRERGREGGTAEGGREGGRVRDRETTRAQERDRRAEPTSAFCLRAGMPGMWLISVEEKKITCVNPPVSNPPWHKMADDDKPLRRCFSTPRPQSPESPTSDCGGKLLADRLLCPWLLPVVLLHRPFCYTASTTTTVETGVTRSGDYRHSLAMVSHNGPG